MADLDYIGKRLGNYRLVRLLGQGGFSEVYLGEHSYLKTFAAIKVLRTKLDEDGLRAFGKEMRVLASLAHPNILPTLDFGVIDEIPFIVIGYAPNGTLRQRHPTGSILPLTTVLSYTKPVASALQYAHNMRIIHRNVKPENLLLSSGDEILLSDFSSFSITQSSHSLTIQEVGGTIAYMAPEQIQGKPGPASDQYSLGVVVYEWLSGYRPFLGSFSKLAAQHMFIPPPSLPEKNPTIPPDVEQVVMTALAKDPQQRFASVQAFANALEQAAGSRSNPLLIPGSTPIPPATPAPVSPVGSSPYTPNMPTYAETVQSPYNTPSGAAAPTPILRSSASELPLSVPEVRARRGISRRAILVGLVGIVGLAVAEAVTVITASRTPQAGTPTPTLPKNLIYLGHSGAVNTVVWSPDGKLIASGSQDNTAKVWNSGTGHTIYTYSNHDNRVLSVSWSPNGRLIASASADDTVQVWDAITGRHVLTYPGHSSSVVAIAWSHDSRRIVSGSLDKTVQIWDANTGAHLLTYKGHSAGVLAVTWSPDSARIASGSADKTVQVWNAATGLNTQTYGNHTAGVTAVDWSLDGKYIASGSVDKTARIWDAATAGKTFTFTYSGHSDQVNTVAWSPDNKLIASGSADRTVQVWNTAQTFSFTYRKHSDRVYSVAWSPVDRRVASASADKTVQVWQLA